MVDSVPLIVIGEFVRICVVLEQPLFFDAVELSRVHFLFYKLTLF